MLNSSNMLHTTDPLVEYHPGGMSKSIESLLLLLEVSLLFVWPFLWYFIESHCKLLLLQVMQSIFAHSLQSSLATTEEKNVG